MLAAREQGRDDKQIGSRKEPLSVRASGLGDFVCLDTGSLRRFQSLRTGSLRRFESLGAGFLCDLEEKPEMTIPSESPEMVEANPRQRRNFLFGEDFLAGPYFQQGPRAPQTPILL